MEDSLILTCQTVHSRIPIKTHSAAVGITTVMTCCIVSRCAQHSTVAAIIVTVAHNSERKLHSNYSIVTELCDSGEGTAHCKNSVHNHSVQKIVCIWIIISYYDSKLELTL